MSGEHRRVVRACDVTARCARGASSEILGGRGAHEAIVRGAQHEDLAGRVCSIHAISSASKPSAA